MDGGGELAFGVLITRADSIYDNGPERYQFPKQYLSRASQMLGDWIVYYEPTRARDSRGYFAVAKMASIVPDPTVHGMYLALMEPGSYLEFADPVAFADGSGVVEQGLLNGNGRLSGRAQSAVRPLSAEDFRRIIELGLEEAPALLPRIEIGATQDVRHEFDDEQVPFEFEQERVRIPALTSRILRDRVFRKVVLRAYDERCAFTGLKIINGGGRAEVAAAHIRPVERSGPDVINNGIALSGTAHWMFDRGLLSVDDDLTILVSRHINDRDSIGALLNKTGRLVGPTHARDRPHPAFLAWHRDNCFKH